MYRRHKRVNYFNVMVQKKLRKDGDDAGAAEDSEAKDKKGKKSSSLVSACATVISLACELDLVFKRTGL